MPELAAVPKLSGLPGFPGLPGLPGLPVNGGQQEERVASDLCCAGGREQIVTRLHSRSGFCG